MMDNRITVFITSYNQKDFLIEAIESVLSQTLQPFEIIISDDCSNDGSQEVIARYAHKHPQLIRPFYHKQNIGIPRNKSFALEQTKGNLVTYLDGDDRFLPRKLELELDWLKSHPDSKIVFSNVYYINEKGERTGIWVEDDQKLPTGYVFSQAFSRDFPRGSLFRNELIDYDCLKKVGFFDSEFAMYHDWELRIRLTKHFNVAYCPEILNEYRRHAEGISRSVPSHHFDEMERVYQKNKDLLTSLSETDRKDIDQRLFNVLRPLAYKSIIEKLNEEDRVNGFNCFRRSLSYGKRLYHLGLLFLLLIPGPLYKTLRSIYRGFFRF